jgi:hypothetical protein
VATTFVGALGTGATGVTAFEATEAAPVPTRLVAVTLNEYAVPFFSDATTHDVELVVQDPATGDEVTVYVAIADPFAVAALHETVAVALPAIALTFVGAPGTADVGVTAPEDEEALLVPYELVAVTLKV